MKTTLHTVPCGLCGKPTPMTGTKRCDFCWEMEGRIRREPDLARKVLAQLEADNTAAVLKDALKLLDEVASGFTRHDGLPDNLLPRIDKLLAANREAQR